MRRAWLCGFDTETGHDYEYRREWIVDRLELLSYTFSIEVAAFAIVSKHHHVVLRVDADIWRIRLFDISWFMRALNEPIARAANIEDNCTGKFFEARFKSQALLDEKAILDCMAYVDLNPIRAQLAATPEDSDFTNIKQRIDDLKTNTKNTFLTPFTGNEPDAITSGVPYHLIDYIELVEWTGQAVRDDKRGSIDPALPAILK